MVFKTIFSDIRRCLDYTTEHLKLKLSRGPQRAPDPMQLGWDSLQPTFIHLPATPKHFEIPVMS